MAVEARTCEMHRCYACTCNDRKEKLLSKTSLYAGHQDDTNEADDPAYKARKDNQDWIQGEEAIGNFQRSNTDVVHSRYCK